jgi:hypothetical protein
MSDYATQQSQSMGLYEPGFGSQAGGGGANNSVVQQAMSGVQVSTQTVASAAQTISESGRQTATATKENTTRADANNKTLVNQLQSIQNLLMKNFQGQARQTAQAIAKTRK